MAEDQEVIELEDIDISHIEYEDKSLFQWEEELTVKLPNIPCSLQEVQQSIVRLANQYQIAYNAFSIIMVLCSKAENEYKAEKYRLCNEYSDALARRGAKVSKDAIEISVINNQKNIRLKKLMERYKAYNEIKYFFEGHKTKLEKTMLVCKDILYSVNGSSRIEMKGNI